MLTHGFVSPKFAKTKTLADIGNYVREDILTFVRQVTFIHTIHPKNCQLQNLGTMRGPCYNLSRYTTRIFG